MSKNSPWEFSAMKACNHGLTPSITRKLVQTFKINDIISFSQSKKEDLLRLIEAIQKLLQKNAASGLYLEQSTDVALTLDTELLSLKMISALKGYAEYRIIASCLFPHIVEFIQRQLDLAVNLDKKTMPSQFFTIMEELQPCVKELTIFLPNFRDFVGGSIKAMLGSNPLIYHQTVLLIIPLFEDSTNHQLIIHGIMNYILHKKKNKFHSVGSIKVSSSVIFIVALVQHGLSFHPSKETCYKMAFSFAAHFIATITKNCEKKSKGAIEFLESFIQGLLLMLTSIDWPGARMLFHLISKKLASYLTEKSEYKMMKFALKQMPAIDKVVRKLYLNWEELCKELSCRGVNENVDEVTKVLLAKFLISKSEVPAVGNLNKSNEVLWEYLKRSENNKGPDFIDSCDYNLKSTEAAAAAFFLDFKKLNYSLYAKHVLSAISSDKRDVKAAAVKGLSDMIIFEPKLLVLPNVAEVIDDCLATDPVKKAIANAMGAFFTAHPNNILQFSVQFVRLFNDQDPQVRLAAVKAISAVHNSPDMLNLPAVRDLLSKLIVLAEDEDVSVNGAVMTFFKTAWLGENSNIDSLINICKRPNMLNFVGVLLATLQCQQRAVCLSQQTSVAKYADASQEQLGNSIHRLTDSLIQYLNVKDREIQETVLSIIRLISKAIPLSVEPYVDIILSCIDCPKETVKRLAAESLRNVMPNCSQEQKNLTTRIILKELESMESLDWEVTTLATFLKLLHSIADGTVILSIINTASDILENAKICKEENIKQVKKALCQIYVLKSHDDTKDALLTHFLRVPEYNLTLISIACQVRLDLVPIDDCAFLEKEVKNFLGKFDNENLMVAALYFIYCTLHGYKCQVQAPNIKTLDQSTTEVVSNLLQSTLDNVLTCSLHPDPEVRKGSNRAIILIVESGLILMPRLLPHICAMTSDPQMLIRNSAKKLLMRAAECWDISLDIVEGIRLAYILARTQTNGVIRGFNVTNGRATCHVAYEVIQESPPKRRKFIKCIAKELLKTQDAFEALYIADQISGIPFHFMDEIVCALSEIFRLISSQVGEKYFSLYLLEQVTKHLTTTYKISYQKIRDYSPPKAKTTEVVRRPSALVDYLEKEILIKISDQHLSEVIKQHPESDEESDTEEDEIPLSVLQRRMADRKEHANKFPVEDISSSDIQPVNEKVSIQKENIAPDVPDSVITRSNISKDKDFQGENAQILDVKKSESFVKEKEVVCQNEKSTISSQKRVALEPGCKLQKKKLKVIRTPTDDVLQ